MVTDTMLHVSRINPGRKMERIIMGNAVIAGELAEIEELDELYRLNASEGEPEPEPEGDEPDDDEGDEGDGEGIEPEDMPHP